MSAIGVIIIAVIITYLVGCVIGFLIALAVEYFYNQIKKIRDRKEEENEKHHM